MQYFDWNNSNRCLPQNHFRKQRRLHMHSYQRLQPHSLLSLQSCSWNHSQRWSILTNEYTLKTLDKKTSSHVLLPQIWCQPLISPSLCWRRIPPNTLLWSHVSRRLGPGLSPFHSTTGQSWLPVWGVITGGPYLSYHLSWISTRESSSATRTTEARLLTVSGCPWKLVWWHCLKS